MLDSIDIELVSENPISVSFEKKKIISRNNLVEETEKKIIQQINKVVKEEKTTEALAAATSEKQFDIKVLSFSDFNSFEKNYNFIKNLIDSGWEIISEIKKTTDHIIKLKKYR
jgi:ethanolamine utilization protein EutQ (cupin superfamily)